MFISVTTFAKRKISREIAHVAFTVRAVYSVIFEAIYI